MLSNKALGPDGFTGKIFKSYWDIIKIDVVTAFNALHDTRTAHFNLLNSASVVLIPKKEGAEGIGDYRPTSLVHGFAKLDLLQSAGYQAAGKNAHLGLDKSKCLYSWAKHTRQLHLHQEHG